MGKEVTDKVAKDVALTSKVTMFLLHPGVRSLPKIHNYTPEDLAWIHRYPWYRDYMKDTGGGLLMDIQSCQENW